MPGRRSEPTVLSLTRRLLQHRVQVCFARRAPPPLCTLPLDTLRDTLDTVASHEELLADFAATPTLARLVDGINQSIGATFLPGAFGPGPEEAPNPAPTRLLRDLLTQMSERIDGQPYRSPW